MSQPLCFHSAAQKCATIGAAKPDMKADFPQDVAVTWTITPLLLCNGGFLYTTALSFHVITPFLFMFACAPPEDHRAQCDGMGEEKARCKQNV